MQMQNSVNLEFCQQKLCNSWKITIKNWISLKTAQKKHENLKRYA